MNNEPKKNELALIALILAFVAPPIGIVVSIISLIQIRKRNEDRKAMALAGFVIATIITFSPIFIIGLMVLYQAVT